MSITTSTLPFELATKGTLVRNKEAFESISDDYSEGESGTYPDSNGVEATYYTSQGTDSLCIRFVPANAADDPETDYDDRYLPDIEPGSSGTLELYIIPKNDGALTVDFSIDVMGYAYVDEFVLDSNNNRIQDTDEETGDPLVDKEGNPIYKTVKKLMRISDVTTSACNITQAEIDSMKMSENFLKTHIMFFSEESNTPSSYYYVNPLVDSSLTFNDSGANLDGGAAYPVPIHWMWINTFGQIALKNNDSGLRGTNIPIVQDGDVSVGTDKAKVIKYLKDNKSNLFYDLNKIAALTDGQKSGKNEEEINSLVSTTIDSMIDNADIKANYDALSLGYNDADYEIGTKVNYFIIEVKAECD